MGDYAKGLYFVTLPSPHFLISCYVLGLAIGTQWQPGNSPEQRDNCPNEHEQTKYSLTMPPVLIT